ncbi:hypothetical protein JQN58_02050 [Aneurinibacillus sp. BA2021]|nr:hypothetical protein [Aneurinibacillus sp. BA2021]
MAFTSLVILGMFAILRMPVNYKAVHKLGNAAWFQNYWGAGLLLFLGDALLFFLTGFMN